ncbi:MAG: hypothetical protein QOI81_2196, partial [Actinomycetota bacterium]|nr:hypothetical protein [Actinomycetota bacterium]
DEEEDNQRPGRPQLLRSLLLIPLAIAEHEEQQQQLDDDEYGGCDDRDGHEQLVHLLALLGRAGLRAAGREQAENTSPHEEALSARGRNVGYFTENWYTIPMEACGGPLSLPSGVPCCQHAKKYWPGGRLNTPEMVAPVETSSTSP